jgi:hypothetical protein
MDYKLIKPITKANGEQIESVTVKESFVGKDLKDIGNTKGEGDALIALVACATGQSSSVVLNMDARDVKAIGDLARPFLAGGEV